MTVHVPAARFPDVKPGDAVPVTLVPGAPSRATVLRVWDVGNGRLRLEIDAEPVTRPSAGVIDGGMWVAP